MVGGAKRDQAREAGAGPLAPNSATPPARRGGGPKEKRKKTGNLSLAVSRPRARVFFEAKREQKEFFLGTNGSLKAFFCSRAFLSE